MDFEAYSLLTSAATKAGTDAFIRQKIFEHSHIEDGSKLCKLLEIPYLELELPPADYSAMIREAQALSDQFVSHRSYDSQGWKSLCLHGIGPQNTLSYDQYGYTNEKEVPYCWTSAADLCPETTAWLKKIFELEFFKELYRVRFMWLEPGGYINFHWDRPPGQHSLGPLNIALNMPEGCHWVFKKWGQVPFRAGSAFAVDISNEHSVWNNSNEARIHIIIHGKYGPAYYRAIADSVRRLKASQGPTNALQRLREPKIYYGIWNHLPAFPSFELHRQCRSLTLHFLRLKSRKVIKVEEDHSLSRILEGAYQAGSDWCVVIMPGNVLKYDFFLTVEKILAKASEDVLLFAHILDRKERGFGLHEQFMIVNVKKWKQIGSPRFLPPAKTEQRLRQPLRSAENIHDDYTPLWLKPNAEERSYVPRVFAWNVIEAAMKWHYTIENIPMDLRQQKAFLYPEENPKALGAGLDSLTKFDVDIGQFAVSDTQKNILQDLRVEASGYGKIVFLFNTEGYWDVRSQKQTKRLDALYTVASGFKDLFILRRHGFHNQTKLVYFDISESALKWKKILFEKWDGRDFPTFCEEIFHQEPNPLEGAVFSMSWEEVGQHWKRELEIWGGEDAFREAFLAARELPKDYVKVDIVSEPSPLLRHIEEKEGKNFAVWYSNCFNYLPMVAERCWDLPWIESRGLFFLSSLHRLGREKGKDILLYGEDVVHGARCSLVSGPVGEIFY